MHTLICENIECPNIKLYQKPFIRITGSITVKMDNGLNDTHWGEFNDICFSCGSKMIGYDIYYKTCFKVECNPEFYAYLNKLPSAEEIDENMSCCTNCSYHGFNVIEGIWCSQKCKDEYLKTPKVDRKIQILIVDTPELWNKRDKIFKDYGIEIFSNTEYLDKTKKLIFSTIESEMIKIEKKPEIKKQSSTLGAWVK